MKDTSGGGTPPPTPSETETTDTETEETVTDQGEGTEIVLTVRRTLRDDERGSVGGGGQSAGDSLTAWLAKLMLIGIVLIIVAAWAHGWSHGLLP